MKTDTPAIKAIIFDCFGVIYNDTFRDFLGRYASQLQKPLTYYSELQRQSDLGQLSDADFYARVADTTGLSAAQIEADRNDTTGLDQAVIQLITILKQQYTIGMLSNVNAEFLGRFLDNRHIRDLFEVIIASSDTGYVKPQPEIFQLMLRRLGLTPGEVIFIDDKAGNVQAAEQLGITSILFESAEQIETELERHLGEFKSH